MTFEMQSLNEKLFNAVCKGKTGSVEKLLLQGANINIRDKKDGMTPLLKACQRRNYTMQKILLSNNANPRIKDKLGLSCLHYIAEAGDAESLKMLMAYHASIDAKDVNDSTPLHFASDRNKLAAVDTLVFCGANAFEKNKKGITPLKSSNDPQIGQILKESELVLTGIKNGEIHIESAELEPDKTYRLNKADLTIHTPKSFPIKALSFICRRVRPEYCHPSLKPYRKELLISDTFEFLTSEIQTKALVTMEVPLYDFPDPFEDIYMKTDRQPTILHKMKQKTDNLRRCKDEKKPGRLKWICSTEIDVTNVRAFNLVAFPRKEVFNVGRSQAELFSEVDKFIKISIQENTFLNPKGKVALEVIPSPIYHPEDITSILSVGHFYDLTNDTMEQPQKRVSLRVPLPHDYESDGDLYLVGADVDSDYFLDPDMDKKYDLDHWEIINVNPKIARGCVEIPVQHFSIYVASEAKRNKSKETILSETAELCRRASQRRTFILFLVLVKPVSHNVFHVVIECTTPRKKEDRLNYWISNNYLDQKPSHTGEFESIPGTKYMLRLSGNVETVCGFPKTRLEFHPKKQDNHQQFQVQMTDPNALNAASVDIYEIKDDPDGKEVEEGLVSVAFRLTGTPFIQDMEPINNETFLGFTRDSLLRQLCKNMNEEWVKVAVLLGLSFRTVEIYRTNNKLSNNDKKFKVMQLWRDTSKHRVDYGVDDLVSALHRIDREDLVQIIHKELELWLENHQENQDRFYKWTESKLTGPSFHSSDVEQPVPASDQFFVLLIDRFGNHGNIDQIGLQMGLSRPENDKIFNDALVTDREHQLLRMFVAAREKKGDMFKTFVDLVQSLVTLNLTGAKEWALETAEKWLTNTEKEKNPLPWRQDIIHYLHKSGSQDDLDKSETGSQVNGENNKEDTHDTKQSDKADVQDENGCEHDEKKDRGAVTDTKSNGSKESFVSHPDVNRSKESRSLRINGSTESLNREHTGSAADDSQQAPKSKEGTGSDASLKKSESDFKNRGSTGSLKKSITGSIGTIGSLKQSKTDLKDRGSTGSLKQSETDLKDRRSTGSLKQSKTDLKDRGSTGSLKQSKDNGSTGSLQQQQVQNGEPSVVNSSSESLERSVEYIHKRNKIQTKKDAKGSNVSLQSNKNELQTEKEMQKRSSSDNETQSTKIQPELDEKLPTDKTRTNISKSEEEFATELSNRIVDEALGSDLIRHIHDTDNVKKQHSSETNQNDIQQLRQHLQTTLEPATVSADPSLTSSHEHLNGSTNQNTSREYVGIKLPHLEIKPEEISGHSEVATEDKPRFLDVLNDQLPSADSSDDSITD